MTRLPVDEFGWDTAKRDAVSSTVGSLCSCHLLCFPNLYSVWTDLAVLKQAWEVPVWYLEPRSALLCLRTCTKEFSLLLAISILTLTRVNCKRLPLSCFQHCLSFVGTGSHIPVSLGDAFVKIVFFCQRISTPTVDKFTSVLFQITTQHSTSNCNKPKEADEW